MSMQTVYRYRFYILAFLFCISVGLFWPGHLQPDSRGQYNQAVAAQYSDHHPPMMSFLWHYLDKIHRGEGLMFGLQLAMLYAAMAILLLAVDKLKCKDKRVYLALVPLIMPIYPQVLIYVYTIVKDAQFALSFLLAGSLLSYYTVKQSKPSWLVVPMLLVIMIYGAAVKYQGQFCVIPLCVWLAYLLLPKKKLIFKVIYGLLIYLFVFGAIKTINNVLVPEQSKNYSWQYVKFYDLAAISIGSNQDLMPVANKTQNFTFQKLKDRLVYPSVDGYIFTDDNILQINKSPQAMQELYNTWLKSVLRHPILYLKHRAINLSYALLARPGYQYVTPIINKVPALEPILGTLFYIFMSHLPVIIIGCGYFVLALKNIRHSHSAVALLGLTTTALLMVGLLFFLSMAGTPRYTYISILLVHASHVLAYACVKEKRRS